MRILLSSAEQPIETLDVRYKFSQNILNALKIKCAYTLTVSEILLYGNK